MLALALVFPASPAMGAGKERVASSAPEEAVPAAEQAFFEVNRLLQAGKAAEAIPRYEQALALDPSLHRVRFYLAQALHQVGRSAAALEVLEAYLAAPIGEREKAQALALRSRIAADRPTRDLDLQGGDGERGRAGGRDSVPLDYPIAPRNPGMTAAGGILIGTGAALVVAGALLTDAALRDVTAANEAHDANAYASAGARYYGGIAVLATGGVCMGVGFPLLIGGARPEDPRVAFGFGHLSLSVGF